MNFEHLKWYKVNILAIARHFPTFYSSASLTPNTNSLISKSDRIAHRSDRPPTFYSSASLTPNTSNLISKSDSEALRRNRRIFPQEP